MVVPVVAATGIVVRNTADKFSTIAVDSNSLAQRSAIYDREGNLITYVWNVDLGAQMTYANGIDRQPVNYDQISPNMLTAIVAIEDDRFWQHGALDVKGTLRALVNDLEHKPIQGGSTLEQQYVKNVLVLQDLDNPAAQQADTADNLNRKLDQLRMAVEVAHTMTKQQILAGYLNDSYYGNGAWGIEAAAETYFNTTAAKLTMTQAATLAGIVENPTAYDPINNPANGPDAAQHRARPDRGRPTRAALSARGRQRPDREEARAAPRRQAERLRRRHGWPGRLLLRLRGPLGAPRPPARRDDPGTRQAAVDRRPEDLHHARPAGRVGRDPRGQLRRPGRRQLLQPEPERRHHRAGAAGHREDPRDRRGPAVRAQQPQGPDRGRLRRQRGSTAASRACRPGRHPSCSPCSPRSSRACPSVTRRRSRTPRRSRATPTAQGDPTCNGGNLPGRELQLQRQGHIHAVHRDGRLDQHLLRRA